MTKTTQLQIRVMIVAATIALIASVLLGACGSRKNSEEIKATGIAYMTARAGSRAASDALLPPTAMYRQSAPVKRSAAISEETFRGSCYYAAQYVSAIEPDIKVIGIYLQEVYLLFDELQYEQGPISRRWQDHLGIVLTDLKTSSQSILRINPPDAMRSVPQ